MTEFIKEEGNKHPEVSRKIWKIIKKLDYQSLFTKPDVMIAGGAILSLFTDERINDLDIFFTSLESRQKCIAKVRGIDPEMEIFSGYNSYSFTKKTKPIQLITRIHGTPQELMDQFDFTVCQACYVPKTDTFFFSESFHEHAKKKEVWLNPSLPYPLASLLRVQKYTRRGYLIPPTQTVLLGFLISQLNIKTYKDFYQALGGLYFSPFENFLSKEIKAFGNIPPVIDRTMRKEDLLNWIKYYSIEYPEDPQIIHD